MTEPNILAGPEDGLEVLRILESAPAQGGIELLYTRRPDAWLSYQREPGESRVFVSRKGGRVIGTCAELIREVYLGGAPVRAAYLCGLKKDAEEEGLIGFDSRPVRALVREDIDCYYFSVVDDNRQAQNMFEKKTRFMETRPLQEYTTYILTPKLHLRTKARNCSFRQAAKADEAAVLRFYRREGSKKDLFPVIRSLDAFFGLKIEDFYLLESGEEIVAAAALWNQTAYKQYVVKKYRGIMKWARMLNPILSLLGYMKLPKENQSLDFPMLSFFLSSDDNEEYYKAFFNHINREIGKKYDVYVIGVPKNYFAAGLFRRLPNIHFDTKLYTVRFFTGKSKEIDETRLYPECGLL